MICPVYDDEDYSQAPPLPKTLPPADEELRLIGDLAVAQVGHPKRFSIDAPRSNVDCNVIVTGKHILVSLSYKESHFLTMINDFLLNNSCFSNSVVLLTGSTVCYAH